MDQQAKAEEFSRHHRAGEPLILVNVWDAGSAAAVERAGAKAIATGSDSVAAAQGFEDGENIPFSALVNTAEQICAQTELPVSIDMEAGYASSPAEVAENAARLLDVGVVGMNLEDQIVGTGTLYTISEQVERIQAVRAMAEERGISLFINARCDVFLTSEPERHGGLLEEAVTRAEAYAEAGASGFFVPMLTELDLLAELVSRCRMGCCLPVNAMAIPGVTDRESLTPTGISRISHGPFTYRAAMSAVEAWAGERL